MNIKPIHIGALKVEFPVMLSPMAGYTDIAFRSICRDFHCGMTYTEVITSRGIVHDSKLTWHMLDTAENEHPVAGHIYGSEPEIMAEAASKIEALGRYDTIDVNCGCPVRKIVAKGAGAALMRDPNKIADIISAIKSAVTLPVTIKTRLGPTPDMINISEITDAAQTAGADAIAIHARVTSKKHSGPAAWDTLAKIKSESSIPVFGNGDIKTAEDVFRMIKETNVDGVLIGRAAIGNPWIFDEVYHLANDMDYKAHTLEEHKACMTEHLDRLISQNSNHPKYRKKRHDDPEHGASRHFRGHLYKYLSGFRGWTRIKRDLDAISSRDEVIKAVESVLEE
jgi:tRNA-dihydrouridine synthase B